MSYTSIKDVFPQIVIATVAGKVTWKQVDVGDFVTVLNDHKIEIEYRFAEESEGRKIDAISLYLWSTDKEIIDSARIPTDAVDYPTYVGYMVTIQRSANRVEEILDGIVQALRDDGRLKELK